MPGTSIPISLAGRIVCAQALEATIREMAASLAQYRHATPEDRTDWEWVQQQTTLITLLTADMEHLRDD